MTETNETGLPAWPERAARRTAANATLADFRRVYAAWIGAAKAPEPIWQDWALRLASDLSRLIPCVDDHAPKAGDPA